jgi:glucose/arabinose dehydrogenase
VLSILIVVTTSDQPAAANPSIKDPNIQAEIVARGFAFPTSMAFLAEDDFLILEKNTGTIKRVVHGQVQPEPVLDVDVASLGERGMLGIAIAHSNNGSTYVFVYFTESSTGADYNGNTTTSESSRNRLYRYDWVNNTLSNPSLLLDLPAVPGPNHNGGKIALGPDSNLYLSVGNLNDKELQGFRTQAENLKDGKPPDGRAGILRITQDGKPVMNENFTQLGNVDPLDKYFAYGIRNSFGMAFDPISGKLWDTENGPDYGDEINLVEPGFNSGWPKVQGIWETSSNGAQAGAANLRPNDLIDFGGRGNYSFPEFIWYDTVGLTDLEFLNSNKYGEQYQNDMFVGDYNNGNLYHFDLDRNRTSLYFREPLEDRIAQNPKELQNILFGRGFGGITDIERGPDGYLYILSAGHGMVYRIVPC